MTKAGDELENPITGERAVVREGTEDTGGERIVTDLYLRPDAAVVGAHVHSYFTERFEVVEGRVGFRLDRAKEIAEAGRAVVVEPGMAHDFWNAGDSEAHLIVTIEPGAERFELMIQTMWGLAADGKTNAKGVPHLLQLAATATEFRPEFELLTPPRWIQRVLFGALAPIARARGYRGIYYPEQATGTGPGT
jgi:quercetin dioxygenase-like cupin family protein